MSSLSGNRVEYLSGNPYWELLKEILDYEPPEFATIDPDLQPDHPRLHGRTLREFFLEHYCHTIPSPGLDQILHRWLWSCRQSSAMEVVSIGAGTGYLEALLSFIFTVIAFDTDPPDRASNEYHARFEHEPGWDWPLFHPVHEGGPEKAALYPEATLLLSWPPPGPLAFDALTAYRGDYLVYIGAWADPGQNGSQPFFDLVATEWEQIDVYAPVRWAGSWDLALLFKRKVVVR